jgi:hypothetical protein
MAAALLLPASPGLSQEGAFQSLEGSWIGDGTIIARDGHSEHLRCKAKYYASPSGRNLDQQLRCASGSYRFEVNSGLVHQRDGSIAGAWTETTRNISGSVRAREDGESIAADISGPNFSAQMNLTTDGDEQSVEIDPNSGDIASVKITMRRAEG